MSILSFNFLLFLIVTTIIYYIIPKNNRWISLLVFSIVFFILNSFELTLFLIVCVFSTYVGTNLIEKANSKGTNKKVPLYITIFINLGMLFMSKYFNIIPISINYFGNLFKINLHMGTLDLLAPIGISYYTLSIIGYTIDIYRGAYKPLKNPLKLLLFSSYYPVMVSGPILRYNDIKSKLFEGNDLDYTNIFMGFERLIFGMMKKMVIADQLSILVTSIFADYYTFSGLYIVFGVILYAIQIYCDFSGCMDIVIGASRMYGVILLENFDSPFFSRNLSEFWRRWHISLGNWARDYIMYPLLKSNTFQKIGTFSKRKFGKEFGKKIPIIIAIFILWFLIGFWHGAEPKYIFAAGIMPWVYLTLSLLFEKFNEKILKILHVKTDCFSYHLFQSIRTFLFMCFIWLFVCSTDLHSSIATIKLIFIESSGVFYDLPKIPSGVIFVMLLLVLLVDNLNYKGIDAFELFQEQNIVFKYLVILSIVSIILVFGVYGPGYNPIDFIYGGF